MDNIFEKASRLKLRFHSNSGPLFTEDLWHWNLERLDEMHSTIRNIVQAQQQVSLLPNRNVRKNEEAIENELRLEILKHIITVRLNEEEARKAVNIKREHLARLKQLAAEKATAQFNEQSFEEIQAQIANLETELAPV